MKKRIVILVALMVVLLLVAGPAYATPPINVSGSFDYFLTAPPQIREADGNTFIYATDYEEWTGDFEGTSYAPFRVVRFSSGFVNVWYRSPFEGTVLGNKEGTMVIQLVGKTGADGEWYGRWVILSGTGELANIRGQGTWWGPGLGAVGPDIYYSGKIHFEPN